MKIKSILTIAGSDSSSGAGIQADCAVARNLGVYPFCAVTCVTSQGKSGVRRIQVVDPDIFYDQLEVAFEEYQPDAVKIGLMPSSLKPILLEILKKYRPNNVVLDPIKSPTLTAEGADEVYFGWTMEELEEFAPYIHVITPNMIEAFDFIGWEFPVEASFAERYRNEIHQILPVNFPIKNILLKGGHTPENNQISDMLICINGTEQGDIHKTAILHKKIETNNTHGTGCALSAALATRLAMGKYDLEMAARLAVKQIHTSMEAFAGDTFFIDPETRGPAYFTL